MKKEMLINVMQPEECRIAIVEDGILEELYVERTSHESYVGNIYKGRIVNIEPSIQAAFVDFGVGRNGFLHVSDVEPAYYRHLEMRRPSGAPSEAAPGPMTTTRANRASAPRLGQSAAPPSRHSRRTADRPAKKQPVFRPTNAVRRSPAARSPGRTSTSSKSLPVSRIS